MLWWILPLVEKIIIFYPLIATSRYDCIISKLKSYIHVTYDNAFTRDLKFSQLFWIYRYKSELLVDSNAMSTRAWVYFVSLRKIR
jgi:hypothetical protein